MSTYNYSLNDNTQIGSSNSSTLLGELNILDTLKAYVYSAAFLVTALSTYIILAIVFGAKDLKQTYHYILLCQHCVCITGFNAVGALLHGIRSLQAPVARLVCWLIFDVQVTLARSLVITLTLMCVNICLSICCPLRYPALIRRRTCCVMLTTWTLALLNPVLFTILACAQSSWEYMLMPDTLCPNALSDLAPRITSLALLAFLTLLIVASYVAVFVEGYRAGHFSRNNKKGRRTICVHALQLSLHLLPAFVIVARVPFNITGHVVNFLVFCMAQSLSPVVYGLRCHDIWSRLPMILPHCLLPLWNWCSWSEPDRNNTITSLAVYTANNNNTVTTPIVPTANTETSSTAANTSAKSTTNTHTLTSVVMSSDCAVEAIMSMNV